MKNCFDFTGNFECMCFINNYAAISLVKKLSCIFMYLSFSRIASQFIHLSLFTKCCTFFPGRTITIKYRKMYPTLVTSTYFLYSRLFRTNFPKRMMLYFFWFYTRRVYISANLIQSQFNIYRVTLVVEFVFARTDFPHGKDYYRNTHNRNNIRIYLNQTICYFVGFFGSGNFNCLCVLSEI